MVDILREHVYSKGFIQILDKKGKWLAILTQINVYVLIYKLDIDSEINFFCLLDNNCYSGFLLFALKLRR